MDDFFMTSKLIWLKKKVGDEWPDIVQESRLRCIPQSEEPYYAVYLGRAVTNTAINFLRRRSRIEMVSFNEREEMNYNTWENSYEIDFGIIHDLRKFMLARWDAQERDAIFMFFTKQITVREAARMLKRSRSAVDRWLRDVRNIFKTQLSDYVSK